MDYHRMLQEDKRKGEMFVDWSTSNTTKKLLVEFVEPVLEGLYSDFEADLEKWKHEKDEDLICLLEFFARSIVSNQEMWHKVAESFFQERQKQQREHTEIISSKTVLSETLIKMI